MTNYYFHQKKRTNSSEFFQKFKLLKLFFLFLFIFSGNQNVFSQCPQDTDCDLIINSIDLDDDNDGILDTDENTCDNAPVFVPSGSINSSIDRVALHDGSSTPQTINATFPIPGCDDRSEEIQYIVTAFPSAASGSNEICATSNSFASSQNLNSISLLKADGCLGGVTYRIEFPSRNEILNISNASHANFTADEVIIVRSTVPLSVNTSKRPNNVAIGSNGGPLVTGINTMEVRIDNIDGFFGGNGNIWEVSSNGLTVPFVEIEYFRSSGTGATEERFTLLHSPLCDADCDGTPNQFDLDSDDDGCPDTVEAGGDDADDDGILGNTPVIVDENGLVIGQGGYNGTKVR